MIQGLRLPSPLVLDSVSWLLKSNAALACALSLSVPLSLSLSLSVAPSLCLSVSLYVSLCLLFLFHTLPQSPISWPMLSESVPQNDQSKPYPTHTQTHRCSILPREGGVGGPCTLRRAPRLPGDDQSTRWRGVQRDLSCQRLLLRLR